MKTLNTLEGPLASLREQEIALFQQIAESLADIGDEAGPDRQRVKDMTTDLSTMFFIVSVIGEFNAGKSSFINALIGEKLLPTGITPTTEFIEIIRYAETAQRKPVNSGPGQREWAHPNTGAEGVAIVDTPGTGSVFQKHEKTAKDFLHRSDLVIFVISAKHAFAQTERMYLEMAKNYGKKIILVINQADLLDKSELSTVRSYIHSQVRDLLDLEPLIFMVSAREALEALEQDTTTADPGGIAAVRAHLRGIYDEAPPARQKLLAQLDTCTHILSRHTENAHGKASLIRGDQIKVQDVQSELKQQSLSLEAQMREAGASIDTILEGVRARGINFIDANLSPRRIGGSQGRDKLQSEFQDVVIGRALRDINEATGDYINAIVDQSRLYWRGVIDRLSRIRDLMEQEPGGLDSSVYAEQRASVQDAIRIAEAELKSYSSGRIVAEMEQSFSANMGGLRLSLLAGVGGLAAAIVGVVLPGPLMGVAGGIAASPLALPAVIIGAPVAAIGGLLSVAYFRRIARETRTAFHSRIDTLIDNYHNALDELTAKERARLLRYGNQILTPILGRLDVMSRRYQQQTQDLEQLLGKLEELRERISKS